MTAVMTVVFFGANATLEGAQQAITSPTSNSRILSVDVLVCTSTTTLDISSHCIRVIDWGNLTGCTAFVSANASAENLCGDDRYISDPAQVAKY